MTTVNRAEVKEELRFEALKVAVLRKMTTVPAIAGASGMALRDAEGAIEELAASGDVASVGGHVLPTVAGETRVRSYADKRYGSLRADPAVERWYARFESINHRFLETVSAWRSVPVGDAKVPNNHSDGDYDTRVISRIGALVVRMTKLLDELSDKVPRMARYEQRLEAAMEKIDQGDRRFFSDSGVDSTHTVWFEMDEAVLIVLGKEREER
jgi:hypothetical protein